MRLLYIANVRIPTEKAHGLQIMKMCEAWGRDGEVELVIPRRMNFIREDPYVYYKVEPTFRITTLPTLDLVFLGYLGFLVETFIFSLSAFLYVLFKDADVFYSRDVAPLLLLTYLRKNCFFEIHTIHNSFLFPYLLPRLKGTIAISQGLKEMLLRNYRIPKERVCVAPDAVDLREFTIFDSIKEARKKLGLPLEERIALYAGHLYEVKGAHIFAKAVELLGNSTLGVVVGGTDSDIVDFRKRFGEIRNLLILGRKPHVEIPLYLKAANVLVLPGVKSDPVSERYTSPMKLFEYMASGRPIVASRLPSLLEVVDETTALLVPPEDATKLAEGIKRLFSDEMLASELATASSLRVQKYTWDNRAASISQFFKAYVPKNN